MKVKYDFPRGYSSEMTNARENNEFEAWVNGKFGSRIRDLISEDFTLNISDSFFEVDFTYEDDAHAFLKLFGGREA
ncbi:hypothetical protein [Agrobacterium rosae]|nr:hypothetical protein [Agrobacterium rosae]